MKKRNKKKHDNWNERKLLKMGTWSVRGLNGKEEEVIMEMKKINIEMKVLIETKKK